MQRKHHTFLSHRSQQGLINQLTHPTHRYRQIGVNMLLVNLFSSHSPGIGFLAVRLTMGQPALAQAKES
jgi:hypothetical protein